MRLIECDKCKNRAKHTSNIVNYKVTIEEEGKELNGVSTYDLCPDCYQVLHYYLDCPASDKLMEKYATAVDVQNHIKYNFDTNEVELNQKDILAKDPDELREMVNLWMDVVDEALEYIRDNKIILKGMKNE